MSTLIPGNGLLFMKVGVHASESLEDIINRKSEEIRLSGFAMWGYGGSTCHPSSVRSFSEIYSEGQRPIKLVMEEIDSHHTADQIAADEYSLNGIDWCPINKEIHKVLGSRYALFINDLHQEEFELPLAQSAVAVGPSEGRRGDLYIQGRVDKACLVYKPEGELGDLVEQTKKQIKLVANLVSPYAALLRNKN